jgi:DNA repair ATPase RecN
METDKKISEFNEAVLQIQRLNEIWISCRKNRKTGNLAQWKWELDQAEDELYRDAERLDKENKNSDFIDQLNTINKKVDIKIEDLKRGKVKIDQYYKDLREKERLLRKLQDQAGKGSKLKDMYGDEDMD